MRAIKYWPYLLLLLFLLEACSCKKIQSGTSEKSWENLTSKCSDNSILYIIYNEKYTSKEKFKLKHHPAVSDSVTHINFYLKKDKEKLFLEYLNGFPKFGEEGAYFQEFEPIEIIQLSDSLKGCMVNSSILNKIEDSVIYPALEDKRMYILEKISNCNYKKIPVTFANGLQYTKYSE